MSSNGKIALYDELYAQLPSLIEGIDDWVSIEANVSALLKTAFPDAFFWVGFYNVHPDGLHLGPFQGDTACYAIKKGKGVCGTAWEKGQTIIVPDVELFPGHIACSSLSRSEIVVPVFDTQNHVLAVLDIDSKQLATFNEDDKEGLERICHILGHYLSGMPIQKSGQLRFQEYDSHAAATRIYPQNMRIVYPTIGLSGETGEVAEKVKKTLRDHDGDFTQSAKKEIALELGDVLWYVSAIANDIDLSLEEVAKLNLEKLRDRVKRHQLHGSGDHR